MHCCEIIYSNEKVVETFILYMTIYNMLSGSLMRACLQPADIFQENVSHMRVLSALDWYEYCNLHC